MKKFLTLLVGLVATSVCYSAPTYTSYFNNTHTYTNATVVGTNFAGRGVFTNGITSGASTFTGEITSTLGTITADASALDATATWNNAGVTFTGLKLNITDTASAAGSLLMDLQVGGASRFSVNKAGTATAFFQLSSQYLSLSQNALIASDAGQLLFGASSDTILRRDGAANTLALRNGANAQIQRWYNTYTDASNYERFEADWTANAGFLTLRTTQAGTGSTRGLVIGSSSTIFQIAGTSRWNINSSGHFLASTDNTYDIGASGATRPRNVFVANNVSAAGAYAITSKAVISSPADSILTFFNNAQNNFDRIQFGGTSASFPALKRSSTELQVRLADDSADAPLKSGQLSNTGIRVMTPSSLQTLAAANALLANATKVRVVGSGGAVTLTSTPTIADGSDGQYVMIQGTDDTNTLTVQDQGSLASSNLELGAATRVLGAGDVLVLTFDSTASVWYEVSFANN